MEFNYKTSNGIGIYQLLGSLIGETDGITITESFNENLEAGVLNYIVDLSELKHINSTGLGVLITLLTKARKAGGELFICNPSPYIKNLLLITKLNTIFNIKTSVEEALTAYRAS